MAEEEQYAKIKAVLNNYDYIDTDIKIVFGVLDKNGNPAKSLKFIKRINGYVMTAEAITDSPKKKALYIRSVYKAKTIQKESRMVDDETPRPDVRNAYGLSDSILPQPQKNVNSLSKNNSHGERLIMGMPEEQHRALQAKVQEKLRGKTPKEIAETVRKAQGKTPRSDGKSGKSDGKRPDGYGR